MWRSRRVEVALIVVATLVASHPVRAQEAAPSPTPLPTSSAAPAPSPSPTPAPTPSPESLAHRVAGDLRAAGAAGAQASTWKHVGVGLLAVGAVSLADESARTWVMDHSTDHTRQLAQDLRPLGEAGGLALMAGAWGLGAAIDQPRLELVGQDGLEATLLAGTITGALKVTTGRVRPRDGEGSHAFHPFSGNQSFPSGEATEAFALAAVVSHHSDQVWVRSTAWTLATIVGLDRMELDAHWASDVLAGALIGGGVGHWLAVRHDAVLGEGDRRRVPELALAPALDRRGTAVALEWRF